MTEALARLPEYGTAHLQLALVALAAGALVSLPLGVWVTRRRGLEPGLLGAASVVQTIPSLALLAIMVPAFAALGTATRALFGLELRSIGYGPAVLALGLYSVLPMLRNTVAGIEGVEPALLEAAEGVGMTPRQRLLRVELPLALPVLVAGLRTATVWVVGTATLSTPVGATSLGNFIFSGLQTRNFAAVLTGCVSAAALALLLDQAIRALELGLRRRRRGLLAAGGGVLGALYLYTAASFALGAPGAGGGAAITVGAKTFTEQYVLAAMIEQRVERATGLPARTLDSLGSTVLFDALRTGEIDLYVDYSGTLFATVMERRDLPQDRGAVLGAVEAWLAREHGIRLVARLGFENRYALAVREGFAARRGLRTISALAPLAPGLEMGADYEFFDRPEWRALREAYGLRFRARRSMDPALLYQGVAEGEVDVIAAFSTDGRIRTRGLRVLRDDRGVIPPYDALLLARPGLAGQHPGVIEALAPLEGAIDAEAMRRMNAAVDQGGRSPAAVAADFLAAEGLRARSAASGEPAPRRRGGGRGPR